MERDESKSIEEQTPAKPKRNFGFLRNKDKGAKPQSEFIRMNEHNRNPLALPVGPLPHISAEEIRLHNKIDDC